MNNYIQPVVDYIKGHQIVLDKPIVFFDLETTGVDILTDRVIEISAIKINPDYTIDEFYSLVNPERPIPEDARNVNQICNDDVKNAPKFSEIVDKIEEFFGSKKNRYDLGGYNITSFDIPLLVEEFIRCGKSFRYGGRRIIDAYKILVKAEPRDLKNVYKNFTGQELEHAHKAQSDTAASAAIAFRQMDKYGIDNLDSLAGYATNGMVDASGFFRRNQDGTIVFAMGKYKGRPVKEVYEKGEDKTYFEKYINVKCGNDVKNHLQLILADKE